MANPLYPAINWFIQFIEVLPFSIRSFLYWVLACFGVVFVYSIVHMWVAK